jgi:hypothetical protein
MSEFIIVAASKDYLKTICEIFLSVYFLMIVCDAGVMISSTKKRDFILQNFLAYLIFFSNIVGILTIIFSYSNLVKSFMTGHLITNLEMTMVILISIFTLIKFWLDYKKLRKYF